jgi:transposase
MAYSVDFRRKVLSVRRKKGLTIAEVAARFDVGMASVVRWSKNVERKPQGTRHRKLDLAALRQDVLDHPDAYQHERAQRFGVAQNAIFVALKKLTLSYKKTRRHPKADEDERRIFRDKIAAYGAQHRTIVSIDESSFAHDRPRRHGYVPVGQRCPGVHNWHARGRTNAIGALIGKDLLTVELFDANVDADVFTGWVQQDLLPKLPPASILVMDNATFHKRPETQAAIMNEGHTLKFLPAYSPDLNPIEHTWARLKARRRASGVSIEFILSG